MGYTTTFSGSFTVTPPLSPEQVAYLNAFNRTRRMARDAIKATRLPDPVREAVGLPIGAQGGYFVGAGEYGQDGQGSIVDYNKPPAGQPGLWCQWAPADDGSTLQWDDGEKFYNYSEWLLYLVEHFLAPWGRMLDGKVHWQGEDAGDRGILYARQNVIDAVTDTITNEGPR